MEYLINHCPIWFINSALIYNILLVLLNDINKSNEKLEKIIRLYLLNRKSLNWKNNKEKADIKKRKYTNKKIYSWS